VSDKPTKINRKEVIEIFGNKDEFIKYHNENHTFNEIINFVIE
jgi:hypothetical protein